MVELLKYEIVSPEEKVVSGEAESILVPGYEGDFTVLSNHAAYLSTLRPGILKIFSATENSEYFVSSGFAEVSTEGLVVLAERALEKSNMSKEEIDSMISDLEAKIQVADGGDKDRIEKKLSELKVLL